MGRLIILLVLVMMVLIAIFVVRAIAARKRAKEVDRGWYAQRVDIGEETVIMLCHFGRRNKIEARISLDDPDYSNRVIEEFAEVQVKADERNTLKQALQP